MDRQLLTTILELSRGNDFWIYNIVREVSLTDENMLVLLLTRLEEIGFNIRELNVSKMIFHSPLGRAYTENMVRRARSLGRFISDEEWNNFLASFPEEGYAKDFKELISVRPPSDPRGIQRMLKEYLGAEDDSEVLGMIRSLDISP